METVGIVGTGAMGSRIAIRLLDAGYDVVVWNRSQERLVPLLSRGAGAAASPRETAARSRVLITMLADPEALRAASAGTDGIAAGAHPGLVVVEMSTVGPAAVRELASVLGPHVRLVDAPVLGSIGEAESGGLTILVGGPDDAVSTVETLLAALGNVVRVGPLGTGAAAKLVANAALLGTLTVLGETLALADALDLPREAAAMVLAATPLADQAVRRLPSIESGVYPRRFALSLARKDADLILDSRAASAHEASVLDAAHSWLRTAEANGDGDKDYTAVLATMLRGRSCPGEAYDGLIVDLDGVVWLGGERIDGVAEALGRLRARGVRVLFLTNDPQHSAAAQAYRLRQIGISATDGDVLTVSAAAASYLSSQDRLAGSRAFVVGPRTLHDALAAGGLRLVPAADAETAQVVVVAGHSDFNYAELHAAVRAIDAGAELFATGRDPFVPALSGREPATGAILASIETAAGATATILGKPQPHIFRLARQLLADCVRVAVVGDNLAADIVGAKRAGLDAILVLSGATARRDLSRAETPPDLVLSSLAALG